MSIHYLDKNCIYVSNDNKKTIYQINSYESFDSLLYFNLHIEPYCIKDYINPDISNEIGYIPAYRSKHTIQSEILPVYFIRESVQEVLSQSGYEIVSKPPIIHLYINNPSEENIINELQNLNFKLCYSKEKHILEIVNDSIDNITYTKIANTYFTTILKAAINIINESNKKITYVSQLPTISQYLIKHLSNDFFTETFDNSKDLYINKNEFLETIMAEKLSNINDIITIDELSSILKNSLDNVYNVQKKFQQRKKV